MWKLVGPPGNRHWRQSELPTHTPVADPTPPRLDRKTAMSAGLGAAYGGPPSPDAHPITKDVYQLMANQVFDDSDPNPPRSTPAERAARAKRLVQFLQRVTPGRKPDPLGWVSKLREPWPGVIIYPDGPNGLRVPLFNARVVSHLLAGVTAGAVQAAKDQPPHNALRLYGVAVATLVAAVYLRKQRH